MECVPWYSHPVFVPSFPGLLITVFFLPFPNWPKRQTLLFSPVREKQLKEREGYRSMQFFFHLSLQFLHAFNMGHWMARIAGECLLECILVQRRETETHNISIPVMLFVCVSHIIHSWKLGRRIFYEGAASQMETDWTAGKDWEKAWRFLLMDSSNDRCNGLRVWQQRLAHSTAGDLHMILS